MTDDRAELLKRITVHPNLLHGKPAIRGMRVPVSLVLNLLAHGHSFDEIIDDFPYLAVDDIRAALTYAENVVDREAQHALAS